MSVSSFPKTQSGCQAITLEPGMSLPDYQVHKIFADASKFPPGKVRDCARAVFKEYSKGKALSMQDVMAMWGAMASCKGIARATDEASTERAKRARKKLGMSRPPGRPKKTGQE